MSKILWISECYPSKDLPQYCIFLEQQVQALINLGHKVDIFIPSEGYDEKKLTYEIYNGVNIYKIGYHYIDKYQMFISNGAKSLKRELTNIVRKENYDILAVHIVPDLVYNVTNKVAKELGVKNIITLHGLNVYNDHYSKKNILNKMRSYRRKTLFSKSDAIISVSEKVKNVVKSKINNVPIYCVYNGVDTELFFSIDKKSNIYRKINEIIIVAVGNLIKIKGFEYLINAIDMIVRDNIKVKLYILGRGKEEKNLKEQVKKLKLENIIEFVGYKPYDIVRKYMQNSDIFILPSYFEAIGCVYLEAMACGLPTIGVKGQGIDEIIIDEKNGMLVEPQDVKSIYEKLKLLVIDEQLRNKISENAISTIENFTWKKSAENLDKVYNEVLKNRLY